MKCGSSPCITVTVFAEHCSEKKVSATNTESQTSLYQSLENISTYDLKKKE